MGGTLRPTLAALQAYQPEAPEGDAPLDANENPLAPPEGFMAEAQARLAGLALNRYPDPRAEGLRSRLAALHGLPPEALVFGNGSDELIALLLTAFGGGEALCLLPQPTFSLYRLCALGQGWRVEERPLDEAAGWDLDDAFVEAAHALRPRLIFLASPNNPTGKAFDSAKVDALRGLPGCTLVLDEAYVEFGGRSLLKAAAGEDGLVVLRTFSKAWGLAGLRLGWLACAPALAAELEKLRLPYNLNTVSQTLGELALDRAETFLGRVPALLARRDRLRELLETLPGALCYPSDANFILFRHAQAQELHAALLRAGLRTRRFGAGALESCLRISVGSAEQMERLEAVLAAWRREHS